LKLLNPNGYLLGNIYNSFKGFLIFSAFYLVFYYYHQTVIYDRLYLLILVQSAIFAIYIVSIYRIKIGLYIFIFLLPLLNSVTTIIGIRRVTIIFYLFVGLFLGYLVNQFKSDKKIVYEKELSRPIFIFIIILTISSAITIYRYANFLPFITARFHDLTVNNADHTSLGSIKWTLKYYFNYLVGFGLFVIVFNVLKKKRDFLTCMVIALSTSIIVIIFGFYQKYFYPTLGSSTFWVEAGRINSTFTDPNALGGYIVLIFPLFISMIIFFKRWYFKLLSSLLLAVFIYFGFLSGSRSAFLSIMISSVIFIIIGLSMAVRYPVRRKVKNPNRSILISGGIVIIIFLIIISSFIGILLKTEVLDNLDKSTHTGIIVLDRMLETIADYSRSIKSESFWDALAGISSGREILWRQAFYMYSEHPVSGVGQAAYFIELPDYHIKHSLGFPLQDFTGNYYLQILSELGTVGILLVLFIFFLILKKPLKYFLNRNRYGNLKREDWLAAGLLISFTSMAVVLFFGPHTNFIEVQFLFWLVISLLLGYININSGNENKVETYGGIILEGDNQKVSFDLVSRIILGLTILIFSFTLLWSSTHDLSINIKNSLYDHDNNYFYDEEYEDGTPFRWTGMDASESVMKKGDIMTIPMRTINPVDYKIPNFIRVYVNNTLMRIIRLPDDQWHDVEIDLSKFDRERITLTISMNHAWIPRELGLSSDTRELGIKVGKFRFED
jgi:O-antigen ligase